MRSSACGFTLIEMLSVMAMVVVVTALSIPAVQGIKSGNDVSRAAYDLAGTLEQARSYAMAHNTYVWVGFFEEDGVQPSRNPAVAGEGGRIVISVVASRDGTRYSDAVVDGSLPEAFGAGGLSNQVDLVQISRLIRLDGVRLAAVNLEAGNNQPPRPAVPVDYQVGDPLGMAPNNTSGAFARRAGTENPTRFTFPLESGAPQYSFAKIIEFNPRGEASKIAEHVFSGPGPQDALEMAFIPMRGKMPDPLYSGQDRAAAAVQIEGLTGKVRIFR